MSFALLWSVAGAGCGASNGDVRRESRATGGGQSVEDGAVEGEAVVAIAQGGQGATRWRPKMTERRSESCRSLRPVVRHAARKEGVDGVLLLAVAWVESGFSARASSSAGAVGPLQLLPHIARAFGCKRPRNAVCAAGAAARLYARLLSRFDGHDVYALCAYNAGSSRVSGAFRRGETPFNYGYAERVFAARDYLGRHGCKVR